MENLWTACSGRCSNVKKLIKYDLKYGAKIFIVIHALLWIAAIFGRVFFLDRIDFDAPAEQLVSVLVLFFSAFVLLFSVVSLATALLIAARFYKNLFTDEGYLTWTLPASPVQQLWAKILSGCIWNILDLILLYSATYFMWISPNVQNAYRMIAAEFTASLGMPLSKFFLLMVLLSIIGVGSNVLMLYASISIGQLFPAHRLLLSVIVYFIFYMIIYALSMGALIIFKLLPGIALSANTVNEAASMSTYLTGTFLISLVLSAVMAVIQYVITHLILTRKLNLI